MMIFLRNAPMTIRSNKNTYKNDLLQSEFIKHMNT